MIQKIVMENLICSGCAGKIETALKSEENINNATFNFTTQTMLLEVTDNFIPEQEITHIKNIVDSIETGVNTHLPNQKQEQKKKYINSLLIGLLLYVLTIYVLPVTGILETILIWGSYILVTNKILLKTIKGLKRKDYFNENTLMFIATIAAMLLGEYTEALLVILFYSFGEFLQNYAVKSSKSEIKGLIDLKIEYANVRYGDEILLKDPSEVQIDDILVVKSGERIPVDGIIIKGETDLNTSALTGESALQSVKENDTVLSGNINVGNVIEIQATKTYENSTVAKIIDLIENATNTKANPEKFITTFSKYYTPFVTIFALLMFIIPTMINPDNFYDNAYRSATFLVISCPCALVLSIPLSYFSGIGASAKEGILFKGSSFLDMLLHVDTIALDKTGTITKGNFTVTDFTNQKTLQLAASLEQYSNHPIAHSIIDSNKDSLLDVKEIKEIPGKGLTGKINDDVIYVGNELLLTENNISVTPNNEIGTIIHVGKNKQYIGYILIQDEIKETSKEFILSNPQYHYTMLTGDNIQTAQYVSNQLGDINYSASLLPEDKINAFEQIDSEQYKVFIGDGINDAPLLKQADIGIAMGKGSELAIDVADVIIMDNDLSKVSKAITIAQKTRKIVTQNIVLTLGLKLLILGLGTIGLSSMLAAIFADVGVSLIAVLNSLRIIFGKKHNTETIYRDELFKVLSDATVLGLLDVLYQKDSTLKELSNAISKSSYIVVKKLDKLLKLNIIKQKQTENEIVYEITDEHIKSILKSSKHHAHCQK